LYLYFKSYIGQALNVTAIVAYRKSEEENLISLINPWWQTLYSNYIYNCMSIFV